MKTASQALVLGLTITAALAVAEAQEMVSLLSAAGQFGAADQAGIGSVVTGPETDPRPSAVGPSGHSAGCEEPWQKWVQQPVATPLLLEVNVKAEIGTQVTISLAGQNYSVAGFGLETESPTNRFYPNLKPYQPYSMAVSGPQWQYIKIVFKGYTPRHLLSKRGPRAIPRPFKTLVDAKELLETEPLEADFGDGNNYSTNWLVEVRPDRGLRPVFHRAYEEIWTRDEDSGEAAPGDGQWLEIGPGRSTSPSSGAFRWSVSLGRLWTGVTAGRIRLCEQTMSSNLYNGLALSYVARSTNQTELHVITNANGSLRQIKAPQALVDIQCSWSPTQECLLRFYVPAHVGQFTNGLYQIPTNSPFVTWRLRNPDSPGTYSRFQVVEQRPSSRTYTAELFYSNSVWHLNYGTGNDARTERRTVNINGASRQESVQILQQTNVVYKALEGYVQFPWGWELTNVVTNPDGNALTNRFVYYTEASVPAAYGRLKERYFPGGRWELYCYPYVDEYGVYQCAGWPTNCGSFTDYPGNKDSYLIRIRPWKDGPTSPSGAVLSNIVVTESCFFSEAVGAHESHRTTELVFRDGAPVILDMEPIADGDYQQPEDSYWANDWRWRGQIDNSHTHTIRCRRTGFWMNDLVRLHHFKTGEADLYEYQRGFFNITDLNWTPNETNGVDVAKLKTTGLDYLYYTAYETMAKYTGYFPYDATEYRLDCIQGKATQELTILQSGNPVFSTLSAMSGVDTNSEPVFGLIEKRKRSFDSLGHLTNEVWFDAVATNISRTVYQASWRDANGNDTELKTWEVNELGERFEYGYDSQKRLASVTRVGVSQLDGYPAQPNLATNFVYNVAGWLLQETVSAGNLSLTRSQAYDLAGRVIRTTSFDGVSVTNSYSADTLTTTETFPGGLVKQTTRYLDGRLRSITGDTVAAEYYDYLVDAEADPEIGGTAVERVYHGAPNSPRWKEQIRTSFGQIGRERMPAFSVTNGAPPIEVLISYWDELAACPMEESPFSVTTPATVLLIDGQYQTQYLVEENHYTIYAWTVAEEQSWGYGSATRTRAQDTTLEWDNGNWWRVTRQWWTSPSSSTRTNTTRERLTGFASSAILRDITVTDPNGNITTIQITLDQANKKLTAVTNTPRSTINITGVTINGLLQSVNTESYTGLHYFYYDALRRPVATKDPLGFTTGTTYDSNTGWVIAMTNAAGQVTQFTHYAAAEANSGKVKIRTDPNGKKTCYSYNNRGQLLQVWGDVPYPEERVYNDYGDLTELHTYQTGTNWSSASWPGAGQTPQITRWTYDPATGLVLGKFDDAGRGYTNMYHWTRTLWRRHWARGVVVTNSFNVFGELLARNYSDGTPPVQFSDYNALGQPASVTDGFGTANFSYDEDGNLLKVEYGFDTPFWGLSLTNRIDPVYGRDRVVVDGQFENPYQVTTEYVFDPGTGRLSEARTWQSSGASTSTTNSVSYQYLANSDLLEKISAKSNDSTVMTTSKIWDYGYQLRSTSTGLGSSGPPLWSFEYEYDNVDRRTRAKLADSSAWNYQYDDRNQVVSGKRVWWDTPPVAGQQFEYSFDPIGNRTLTKVGGDGNGVNLRMANYTNNALNQITGRGVPGYVDVIGAATASATNVSVNGQPADCRRIEYYWKQLAVNNGSGPVWQGVTNSVTLSNQTVTVTGRLLVPGAGQTFSHDADGNLTNDTIWAYWWDGENRLKAMEVLASAAAQGVPRVRLDFGYDWQGRRLSKAVLTNWNGSIYLTTNLTRFVYDGWRPVAELNSNNALIRSYGWGLDLSGEIDAAAGIGGLVEVTDHSSRPPGRHFTVFDGNGNIVGLVKADGTVSARYEYGPFGEPIRVTGTFARTNPFRWSTKYWDEETELVYYGYRYYSPSLGRWISRDPIEERGLRNAYAFCLNTAPNGVDSDGREFTLASTVKTVGVSSGFGGFVGWLLAPKGMKLEGLFCGMGAGGLGALGGIGFGAVLEASGLPASLISVASSSFSAGTATYISIAANKYRFSLTPSEALLVGSAGAGSVLLGGLVVKNAAARGADLDEFIIDLTVTASATMGIGFGEVYFGAMERAKEEGQNQIGRYIHRLNSGEEEP